MITAAMLYDLVECSHRPSMDLFADPSKRDKLSPFVQLLWEKGNAYEQEVIAGLDIPFLDLSPFSLEEKEIKTREAIENKEPLIYRGRISADDLLGEPDLLRLVEDGYVAGDIKSGSGEYAGEDDPRPKKHYAVQLALYTDILERKGLSNKREPFVWDIHGEEVTYTLDELTGKKNPTTLWEIYQERQMMENLVNYFDFGGGSKVGRRVFGGLDGVESLPKSDFSPPILRQPHSPSRPTSPKRRSKNLRCLDTPIEGRRSTSCRPITPQIDP